MKVAARDLERMERPKGTGRALAAYEIPIEAQGHAGQEPHLCTLRTAAGCRRRARAADQDACGAQVGRGWAALVDERRRACRGALTGLRGPSIVARSIQLRRDGGGLELDGP